MAAGNDHVHDLERAILIKDRQLFELNKKLETSEAKRLHVEQTNNMLRGSIIATQDKIKHFLRGIL